jgi:hypothetical protein
MALYKGRGGAIIEIDKPSQEQLDAGDLVLVEKPKPAVKKAEPVKASKAL